MTAIGADAIELKDLITGGYRRLGAQIVPSPESNLVSLQVFHDED